MASPQYNRHLVDKGAELIKFCAVLGFAAFVATSAPDQISSLISFAAAYILGSKVPVKLNF